jgi:polyisoprenoid-binding protein YceI
MKSLSSAVERIVPVLVAACCLMALATAPAHAATGIAIDFLPASKIWLTGNSTLHPFSCTAGTWHIAATLTPIGPATTIDQSPAGWSHHVRLSALSVEIPVKALASGDALMDTNMFTSLQAAKYPTIRFDMLQTTLSEAANGKAVADVGGRLTIAAARRPTTVQANGQMVAGNLHVWGQTNVSMAAYGVTPPALLFGAVKVDDGIVVHFDLLARTK